MCAASASPLRRLALRIAYDGTNYLGWQRQNASLKGRSVQDTVERALSEVLQENITLFGAGRTDSGVHALGQCAHFETKARLPTEALPAALLPSLPTDISVWEARSVPADFDARHSAVGRSYTYLMTLGGTRDGPSCLARHRVALLRGRHDLDEMMAAASLLPGAHNFQHLRSTACQAKNPERTIDRFSLDPMADDLREALGIVPGQTALILRITARAFLMHQVRYIVGALDMVGRGRLYRAELEATLRGEKPPAQITPAPPHGLTLSHVDYGPDAPI